MKSVFKALTSNRVSVVLLFIFAVGMAVATFIENDFGTPRARTLVYNALWFEVVMGWLAINFIMQIKAYRLLSKEKWSIGLFHLGFAVTLIGAFVTRYFGFEGWAHIREGQTVSHITSAEPFLQVQELQADGVWETIYSEKANYKGGNFSLSRDKVNGLTIEQTQFYPRANPVVVEGRDTLLQLVVAAPERIDTWLRYGEIRTIGAHSYSFGAKESADVTIELSGDSLVIISPHIMHIQNMSAEYHGALAAQTLAGLHLRMVYQFEESAFLVPDFYSNADLAYELNPNKEDKTAADFLKLTFFKGDNSETITLKEHNGDAENWEMVQVNDKAYRAAFGIKSIPLGFSLELTDFELERYPGSQSPSSFASNLIVHGKEGHFPYRIFMNNVLDYNGFRFFQASYDTDEKGTVLSVNHDFWGTWITYLGYAMLTIFMIWTLFSPKSRFTMLRKKMSKSLQLGMFMLVATLGFSIHAQAQFNPKTQLAIHPEISSAFGELVVQDLDGRMKPMNTLSLEILRKISGKTTITVPFVDAVYTLDADQFVLSTQLNPQIWADIPVIKVGKSIREDAVQYLGKEVPSTLAFSELLDENGAYRLQARVEEAAQKKPATQNDADKEYLKLDERFNIFYGLITGEFLRVYPHKEDQNHTWYTAHHAAEAMQAEDARFAENALPLLSNLIQRETEEGHKQAVELIGYIAQYQKMAGKEVYPNETRLQVELFDNQFSILSRLFTGFMSVGAIWLVIAFVNVFQPFSWYRQVHGVGIGMSIFLFFAFTAGMLLRWYIAERPPWTDGFEMLLLASWGIILMGLITGKNNVFTLPLSVQFTGVLLFVAYLDWLNPEITNLVPVLKSYWLKIHVAVIVLGYAPLALSALLSFMYLLLRAIQPKQQTDAIKKTMKDLTVLAEINITIGLFLLTIGTFLGGIWANESWGRYWGWDPKETWALISVIVYAIVLHLRLIPIQNIKHWFNVATMWAFSSIIMTSFGVNYYLAGLHSYAKGDPVPIPVWVWWVTGALLILTVLSFRKEKSLSSVNS
ncbi:cytochrome C biogenesis protein [bacterium]|nr:MAG: cytochrome C biogenesis protein [bacterium]